MYSEENTINKWLNKLKADKTYKNKHGNPSRKHSYKHFDLKIHDPCKFLQYVKNFEKISKHAFLPFIRFEKKKFKYKKDKNGIRKLVKRDENRKLKTRELMYASHLDTLIYVWYQCILEDKYEQKLKSLNLDQNVLAYRKILKEDGKTGKCNIDFANEVFNYIKPNMTALAFDISDFFPSLSHTKLKQMWVTILEKSELPIDHLNILRSLTKYSFIDIKPLTVKKILQIDTPGKYAHKKSFCEAGEDFGKNFRKIKQSIREAEIENNEKYFEKNLKDKGIPQGSPLSGLLANIYLLDYDKIMNDFISNLDGIYRRYSDDIIVVIPVNKVQIVEDRIMKEISSTKDGEGKPYLEKKKKKTSKINFGIHNKRLIAWEIDKNNKLKRKSLQYLGFEFDGKKRYIRSGSIAKLFNKLDKSIRRTRLHGNKGGNLLIKKLYKKFTPKGNRNFFSYIKKAKKIIPQNGFNKQIKKVIPRLHSRIS